MAQRRVSGSGTVVGRREPVGLAAGSGTVPPVHTTTHTRTHVSRRFVARSAVRLSLSLSACNLIWFRCRVPIQSILILFLLLKFVFIKSLLSHSLAHPCAGNDFIIRACVNNNNFNYYFNIIDPGFISLLSHC